MKKEYKTFDCEYMRIADDPRYLYIHLGIVDGWAYSERYMFLYDMSTKELRCSIDDREMPDFRAGIIKDSYDEIGSIIVEDDVRVDEMISSQDIPNEWLRYKGVFNSDDITSIQGEWGLLWEGDSIETCSEYEPRLLSLSPQSIANILLK